MGGQSTVIAVTSNHRDFLGISEPTPSATVRTYLNHATLQRQRRLGELDEHRGVIAGALAFAFLAHDLGEGDTLRQRG